MQLVLDTNGLIVKKRNESFWIYRKKEKRLISPRRISSIAVTADCLISAAAIRLAAKHEIPIYFFNGQGKAEARLWSANFKGLANIRRAQVLFAREKEATEWVISLFEMKTSHQIACLKFILRKKRNSKDGQMLRSKIREIESAPSQFQQLSNTLIEKSRNDLMGMEGALAKSYLKEISKHLPTDWQFPKRSRRPGRDPFNAALNYLYGMLYNQVGSAVLAAGLDPQLGFLHTDGYQRPSLVFDMIEPFRPWVDVLLVELIFEKKILTSDFAVGEEGVRILPMGRRKLISAFNDRMEKRRRFLRRELSQKNHVYRFAGEFAQSLLNKHS